MYCSPVLEFDDVVLLKPFDTFREMCFYHTYYVELKLRDYISSLLNWLMFCNTNTINNQSLCWPDWYAMIGQLIFDAPVLSEAHAMVSNHNSNTGGSVEHAS